jgi:hypothetical protein
VLLVGVAMPCDNVTADMRTDGRLAVGPLKTNVLSVGVRWSLPLPSEIGQPRILMDDIPREFPLSFDEASSSGINVEPAHKGVSVVTRIVGADAKGDGYLVATSADLQPVDQFSSEQSLKDERAAVEQALKAENDAASASCRPDGHMAVLIGNAEIGPNSVIRNPGQLAGGPNSVIRNPGQLAGGPNSVIRNPGQIAGGPNSVIRNPGQIAGGRNSVVTRALKGKLP